MSELRFDRHARLFGTEGQARLRGTKVAVIGVGGLGSHVVQQLALLGVGSLALVDSEEIEESNRNRYVTVHDDDPVPGTPKVDIGARLVHDIDPTISVDQVRNSLISDDGFDAVKAADCIFGCVDNEGARLALNELCSAYEKRYVDLASEVHPGRDPSYGGRVCVLWDEPGCIDCYDELDREEARRYLAGPLGQCQRLQIYGVDESEMERAGPSVVSINGVVGSLGVTEFMVGITEIRSPHGLLTYRGDLGKVISPGPDDHRPLPDCYYCGYVRGRGSRADVERYIREGVGVYLR